MDNYTDFVRTLLEAESLPPTAGLGSRMRDKIEQAKRDLADTERQMKEIDDAFERNVAVEREVERLFEPVAQAFEERYNGRQMSRDTANSKKKVIRDRLMLDPQYKFDPKKITVKYREPIEMKRDNAEKVLKMFDAEFDETVPEETAGETFWKKSLTTPDDTVEAKVHPGDLDPYKWHSWNDPLWASTAKSVKFGEEGAGTGRGESRLAAVFGAAVQGGSVPFDLVLKDNTRWEVKELKEKTENIRPSGVVRANFQPIFDRMIRVVKELERFADAVMDHVEDFAIDAAQKVRLRQVIGFVDNEASIIMGGEISTERLGALKLAMERAKSCVRSWEAAGATDDSTGEHVVGLDDKEVDVSKPTFYHIAREVELATGANDLVSNPEARAVAASYLTDPAFADPVKFLDNWGDSIIPHEMFNPTISGIIITNEHKGFSIIPKDGIDDALFYTVTTLKTPRFRYRYF